MFSFPKPNHHRYSADCFTITIGSSRVKSMTTSDFRLISGGRSNLIGKEISLSPSLPNRADCSPEVEFILNEEREREREREREHRTSMDVYVQEFNLFFRRNYRAKLFFSWHPGRTSFASPWKYHGLILPFSSSSLYLRHWVTKPPTFNSGWKLWGNVKKSRGLLKDLISGS